MFYFFKIRRNRIRVLLGVMGFLFCVLMTLSLEYFLFISPTQDDINSKRKDDSSLINPVMWAYYVSPKGNDANAGTELEPFATIEKARDTVRLQNQKMTGNIIVYIKGGTYTLSDTLTFDDRDSGTNGFSIWYKSFQSEKVVISGGQTINKWEEVPGKSYWKANFKGDYFRQFYINGERRQRARSQYEIKGIDLYGSKRGAGILVDSMLIPAVSNPSRMQIHFHIDWKDYYLPVSDIIEIGSNSTEKISTCQFSEAICNVIEKIIISPKNKKAIILTQPYFQEAQTQDKKGKLNGKISFFIENDLSLVDQPGEWYFDSELSEIYYFPNSEEKIELLNAVVPTRFQLLKVEGKSLERKVRNIHFEGLTFSYSGTWEKLDKEGWFTGQAQALNRPIIPEGMTPASVNLIQSENITFENNIFEHLGLVGISLIHGTEQTKFQGNIIRDIGDSAITIGSIKHEYPNFMKLIPVNDVIRNNLIYKVGQDFHGAPGIQIYWSKYLKIEHNQISDLPYTGIAVGWGWNNVYNPPLSLETKIIGNRIERIMQVMRDGGGIYTLGAQPNSIISENYISDMKNDYGGVYLDEGSSNFLVERNVVFNTPCGLFLHLTKVGRIHDNRFDNNWVNTICFPINQIKQKQEDTVFSNTHFIFSRLLPEEARNIIHRSGLEKDYNYLKKS
jgi:Right handed beta helix region